MPWASFEWDPVKDLANQAKHGVSFRDAQRAFLDKRRVVAVDLRHSTAREERYYCFGRCGDGILTVRFTFRDNVIRIFGAGYWTRGRLIYEQEKQVLERSRRSDEDR